MKSSLLKSLLCVLLMLSLCCAQAGASGLSGLSGLGGLPKIIETNPALGYVPDPASLLGESKTVFARNYTFDVGYICTVYTYPLAPDESAFISAYRAKAEANGLELSDIEVEGYPALKLSYGSLYAMLLPSYSGVVMLLVQNGMSFGEPRPQVDYISITHNGRTYSTLESNDKISVKAEFIKTVRFVDVMCSRTSLRFRFPYSARKGDEYTFSRSSYDEHDHLLFGYDSKAFVIAYPTRQPGVVIGGDNYALVFQYFKASTDHFLLRITDTIENDVMITYLGEFEGVFEDGKDVLDGDFRISCMK